MENEIKVGEYIRTRSGRINQILEINWHRENGKVNVKESLVSTEDFDFWKMYQLIDIVKKHSSDIIDLIEVKDVIHYRIDHISTTLETKGYIEGITEITNQEMLESIKENKDYNILEVLTKEQCNQTAYKVITE